MPHGPESVDELVKQITRGDFVIPHFQRDFDWGPSMVSDLLVSLLHGYYSGTLLFWQLKDHERDLEMWDPLWGAEKTERPIRAILDGQQRLSSLYYAIMAPEKNFPHRQSYYFFFIHLDNYFDDNEDESVFYRHQTTYRTIESFKSDENLAKDGFFPICLLSDRQYLVSNEYQKWIHEYVETRKIDNKFNLTDLQVSNEIRKILDYDFFTETLVNKQIPEICTVFARINSKGLRLNIFDLLNAFLFPHNIRLKKYWEDLDLIELKKTDSQMKVYLLKLISLIKQKYCSSKYLYNLIPGSIVRDRSRRESTLVKDKNEFMTLLDNSVKYSERARVRIMNTGHNDFGAIKSNYIPNTTILPVLGALLSQYDENFKNKVEEKKFNEKINRWYWSAVISGDYSRSSDSVMAKDYTDMLEWLSDDTKIPERVEKITPIFIDTQINLKRIKNTNSSQYCAVLNLLSLRQAQDFYNGRPLGTYNAPEINDHHIFPIKSGLNLDDDKKDSILNRTLLHNETNNKIKNKKPSQYYLELLSKNSDDYDRVKLILNSHFISEKGIIHLKNDEFDKFILEREIEIKNELKRILGLTSLDSFDGFKPGIDYDNEMKYIGYIESCNEILYLIDPYVNTNTLRLINRGLKSNIYIKEVKILTSIHQRLNDEFKDDYKKFKNQYKQKDVHVELRVVTSKERKMLHDRYLITNGASYNFVSADTASIGQYSHVNKVNDMTKEFISFWDKSMELLGNWGKIRDKFTN